MIKYKYSTTNFAVVPGNLTTTRNVHLPVRYIRQILTTTTTKIIIYFIRQNRPSSIYENQPSREPHGERPRALRLGAPLRHLLVAPENHHGHLQRTRPQVVEEHVLFLLLHPVDAGGVLVDETQDVVVGKGDVVDEGLAFPLDAVVAG